MSVLRYQYYSPTGLAPHKRVTNSSRLVIEAAERQGIAWRIHPGTQVVTLTYNGQERSYYHQVPSSTTAIAKYISNQKNATSNMLQEAGIHVPKSFRISPEDTDEYLRADYTKLQKPLVVKPNNGTWGLHITVGIHSYDDYLAAITFAAAYTSAKNSFSVVEEMFDGDEYRILLTRERVIGVLQRVPAHVVGDGKHTIRELIDQKNREPIRNAHDTRHSHKKIRVTDEVLANLSEMNLTLETVPALQQHLQLRKVSNVSQGGDAIDVTDDVHPSVKTIALKAIRAIPGLSFAGIDFMTKDIKKAQTDQSYTIIEINDSPGFDIHDYPYRGKNRHAAEAFLQLLFPELVITR